MNLVLDLAASDCWPSFSLHDEDCRTDPGEVAPEHESPSLRPAGCGDPPSYELKFVLGDLEAAELEQQFSSWLSLDPHANADLDRSYRISTIYSDTPRFDVYHRVAPHRRTKFRLRRYGDSRDVFLERKTKRGRQVSKNRVAVALDELPWLAGAGSKDWAGSEYRRDLQRSGLLPVCAMTYLRRAYFGVAEEGRIRVTFDRELRGLRVGDWNFDGVEQAPELTVGQVVCEFKFRGAMPAVFKRAMESLGMLPGGFSKYRRFMEEHGLMTRELSAHA